MATFDFFSPSILIDFCTLYTNGWIERTPLSWRRGLFPPPMLPLPRLRSADGVSPPPVQSDGGAARAAGAREDAAPGAARRRAGRPGQAAPAGGGQPGAAGPGHPAAAPAAHPGVAEAGCPGRGGGLPA